MHHTPQSSAPRAFKSPTGITGFDQVTHGGLPTGRTTVLSGGPGSGKTIFALQFLVRGAVDHDEAGIFVAFEETTNRILANCDSFGWDLASLHPRRLFLLDAQPQADLVQSGDFDLSGLLAALSSKIEELGVRRIVFDALDIVLALMPDPGSRRKEIYRIHDWLLARDLTAIITSKAGNRADRPMTDQPLDFMQFMVDCSIILNHDVTLGVSQRNLRVQKFRGSSFDENESPFVIGRTGFDVAVARTLGRADALVSSERVSSGIDRLDTMLGGGYYRGASILITGFPGTAKTTLSGAFAEASCRRGERTLFVSFDSDGSEVVRNLASVGIELAPFVASGVLRIVSARTIGGSAETHLVRIKALADEHRAHCLVIDPVSALSKSGNELTAHSVGERLIDWAKASGITMVCTSLIDEMAGQIDRGSPLQMSTLSDTWIHLNYLVQAGERNRGMSIIKSRGTSHSNQVRELILSDAGVTLADIFTAGGEVLMGTMRWEKESAERSALELADVNRRLKTVEIEAEEAELQVRLRSLQTVLAAKQVEKALLSRTAKSREHEVTVGRARMGELRGADAVVPDAHE